MDDPGTPPDEPRPVAADDGDGADVRPARPAPVRPPSARPPSARPPSARPPSAPPSSARGQDDGSDDPGARPSRPTPVRPARPTPVRAGLDGAEEPDVEVGVEERPLSVDGEAWTAVLLGRGMTGSAPTLLVGFRPSGGSEVTHEAWVVAESLARAGDAALADAWSRARPPLPDEVRTRSLFPGASGERRRGR